MKAASPAFPAVPNSTPASARSRAPIHNPYDKFPQGEFDAWIGDITTVLKRALGQEPPPPPPPSAAKSASVQIIPASLAHFANGVDFDDSVAEDSFAEIKARKAAKAKGKQRAVSEEDEDEFEVEASILQGLDGESEEEEEGSGEESYHPNHQYQYGFDDHGEEYSDEDEEEEEEVEVQPFENNADDPIEILSSDEEDDPQERVSVHHNHDVYEEDEAGDEDSLLEQDEEDEDEDELNSNGFLPSSPQADDEPEPPIELPDVWSGPRQYAEDYYAGGDVQSFGDPSHLGEEDGYAGEEEEEEGDEEEQGEGEEEEEEGQPLIIHSSHPQLTRLILFSFLLFLSLCFC
ncbi:hypothetical protein BC629DRAFT_453864 [Irpex lacteus]|nr:hypothetical protein BC629DRAFT_453864 [Irpex lacteus]